MPENRRIYDLKRDYRRTNNLALDSCAACIISHRDKKIAINSISLKPWMFETFLKGLEDMSGQKVDPETPLYFDKVKIVKGSIFQLSNLLPELIARPE